MSQLQKALDYFASKYANTGADATECEDHALSTYLRLLARMDKRSAIDALYFEAARYEDM